MEGYEDRISAVEAELKDLGSVAICFSGGLDSTVLADISHRILGDRAVAVMCDVPMMADRQRDAGIAVAKSIGIRLVKAEIGLDELSGILENRHDRCYICKTSMYRHVRAAAESLGIPNVINGEIVEDLGEDRPGVAAGPENRILTPFLDAGVHRADVVRYLSGMDIPIHLVKETCMLMRYPEGRPVTAEDLRLVEDLEGGVRAELGISQLRVRRTDSGFAVQTSSIELPMLEEGFDRIVPLFTSKGYSVTLNPVGYDKRSSFQKILDANIEHPAQSAQRIARCVAQVEPPLFVGADRREADAGQVCEIPLCHAQPFPQSHEDMFWNQGFADHVADGCDVHLVIDRVAFAQETARESVEDLREPVVVPPLDIGYTIAHPIGIRSENVPGRLDVMSEDIHRHFGSGSASEVHGGPHLDPLCNFGLGELLGERVDVLPLQDDGGIEHRSEAFHHPLKASFVIGVDHLGPSCSERYPP